MVKILFMSFFHLLINVGTEFIENIFIIKFKENRYLIRKYCDDKKLLFQRSNENGRQLFISDYTPTEKPSSK